MVGSYLKSSGLGKPGQDNKMESARQEWDHLQISYPCPRAVP